VLLRGPQTPGELRSRSDRMYSFGGVDEVESTLGRLMAPAAEGEEAAGTRPLAMVLPRQPGSREARYMHLLGGPVDAAARIPSSGERGRALEERRADWRDHGGAEARIEAPEAEV